jgi:hypothetical protein
MAKVMFDIDDIENQIKTKIIDSTLIKLLQKNRNQLKELVEGKFIVEIEIRDIENFQ